MDNLLQLGVSWQHSLKGRNLKVLNDTGAQFVALLNAAPQVDPRLELNADGRELCVMEIRRPGPALEMNDTVQDVDSLNKWRVLKRDVNNADPLTDKYWAVQVTTQDS